MSEARCRFCKSPELETFVDLGLSPLANSYVPAEQLESGGERFFPLHAHVCRECLLVQLEEFESAEGIFGDYAYFSSYSDSWLRHCSQYADEITARLGLNDESKVVELASNDGYLLQYFVRKGIPVLGVEPAANVAEEAVRKEVPTLVRFFGRETATEMLEQGHAADLIAANNVLAHVPDLNDFVAGIRILLKPEGIATIEFPHLLNLMRENQFDTIYHEHFSYFSLHTLDQVFAHHDLRVFDVQELSTHGGSLRIHVCRKESSRADGEGPAKVRADEAADGLDRIETYLSFAERVVETKRSLRTFLETAKASGRSVAGYGAPAKGNTLLNYCEVGPDLLPFTVDRNPHKQGRYLPGTHVPILDPEAIRERKPDYVLILPWNLRDEIVDQLSYVRDWGGQFVVPIPEVRFCA